MQIAQVFSPNTSPPIFLGDSHAQALARFAGGVNMGVNGEPIARIISRLSGVAPGSTVYMPAGTNDAVGNWNEQQVRQQVALASKIAKERGLNLTWIGPTGPRAEALDKVLAAATGENGIAYRSSRGVPMSMQKDGVHATIDPQGYGAWWKSLQEPPAAPSPLSLPNGHKFDVFDWSSKNVPEHVRRRSQERAVRGEEPAPKPLSPEQQKRMEYIEGANSLLRVAPDTNSHNVDPTNVLRKLPSVPFEGNPQDVLKPLSNAPQNFLELSPQDLNRLRKLVLTEAVHSLSPDKYNKQVGGIVDTALNRLRSGRWGNDLRSVLNARFQFSDINGPVSWKSGRSDVDQIPDAWLNTPNGKRVAAALDAHLAFRGSNPSLIGGHLNYANPHYSDAVNLPWINKLNGPRFGEGKAIHHHGTVDHMKPVDANYFVRVAGAQNAPQVASTNAVMPNVLQPKPQAAPNPPVDLRVAEAPKPPVFDFGVPADPVMPKGQNTLFSMYDQAPAPVAPPMSVPNALVAENAPVGPPQNVANVPNFTIDGPVAAPQGEGGLNLGALIAGLAQQQRRPQVIMPQIQPLAMNKPRLDITRPV